MPVLTQNSSYHSSSQGLVFSGRRHAVETAERAFRRPRAKTMSLHPAPVFEMSYPGQKEFNLPTITGPTNTWFGRNLNVLRPLAKLILERFPTANIRLHGAGEKEAPYFATVLLAAACENDPEHQGLRRKQPDAKSRRKQRPLARRERAIMRDLASRIRMTSVDRDPLANAVLNAHQFRISDHRDIDTIINDSELGGIFRRHVVVPKDAMTVCRKRNVPLTFMMRPTLAALCGDTRECDVVKDAMEMTEPVDVMFARNVMSYLPLNNLLHGSLVALGIIPTYISLLSQSLKKGGLLVLGTSDTVEAPNAFFEPFLQSLKPALWRFGFRPVRTLPEAEVIYNPEIGEKQGLTAPPGGKWTGPIVYEKV